MSTLDVKIAAFRILAAGHYPTVRRVRELLGRGSHRDLTPRLAEWKHGFLIWATQQLDSAEQERRNQNQCDAISVTEHQAKIQAVEEMYEGERRQLMLETDRIRQSMLAPLKAKSEHLELENKRLGDQIFLLEAKLASLQRQLNTCPRIPLASPTGSLANL